jgi:pimeloyl-ACP methyl ester carboxylesterase
VRFSRIRLSTGVELQVAQRGAPNGDPVLFLHGFTDSWFSYSTVFDRLPGGIRAIAPSQRGHGDSERPACCYRVADFAADAVALLDALDIARATVVGHSMGSFVAQRVAADFPGRVNRLVLIGSGATIRTPLVLEINTTVQKLTDPVPADFVRQFQRDSVARELPEPFFAGVLREAQKVPARVWRDVLGGLLAPDAANRLDRITSPTLVVWGDKDALWDAAHQRDLIRAIRGARLVTYSGSGHSPQWEEPQRFVDDLVGFLSFRLKAEATRETTTEATRETTTEATRETTAEAARSRRRQPRSPASCRCSRASAAGITASRPRRPRHNATSIKACGWPTVSTTSKQPDHSSAPCSWIRGARCVTGASPTPSARTSICRWTPGQRRARSTPSTAPCA